jgi:hypothetical protein
MFFHNDDEIFRKAAMGLHRQLSNIQEILHSWCVNISFLQFKISDCGAQWARKVADLIKATVL